MDLYPRWALLLCFLTCWTFSGSSVPAQDDSQNLDDLKLQQAAERFWKILEKNPRRGTAFDRVYTHHLEFGSIDAHLDSLRSKLQSKPDDGALWMLLGLFESQKGEEERAVLAFRKASELRPEDAMAPYYCGQSLLRLGIIEDAAKSLELAIDRKPSRTDLLEIYQSLGRLYSRAQRPADAVNAWKRLEQIFPEDVRVIEQIATSLYEEGDYAEAQPRYEKLIQLVKDDFRRTSFRIQLAIIQLKTNQRSQGIAAFESVLSDLHPNSWMYRDVRKRIEDTFLNSRDQDSLVKYYESWIAIRPDDVDAMARLARFLSSAGRVKEGNQWMEKAMALAPSRTELRKSYIDMLAEEQRVSDAVAQYALLLEFAPNNVDYLRDWGKLTLKDKSLSLQDRQSHATQIWNRIVASRPNDASTSSMVADLFRHSNMEQQAIQLYKKAIELAPNEPQYREYLGEYYHVLNEPNEAIDIWQSMAEDVRHTAVNVARLSQVFKRFGLYDKAREQIAEACRLDPREFHLQLEAAEYHFKTGHSEDAANFLARAEQLAANEDERDRVLRRKIESFQESGGLQNEIQRMLRELRSDTQSTEEQWRTLARYCESDRRWPLAKEAIKEALQRNPNSIASLATAAKIAETSGDFNAAIQSNKKLMTLDRRSTGEYLTNIARYEAQLGHADAAVQAAKQLILFAPSNTDHYEFLAQMCFRVGRSNEGLDALRKAIRINPNEPHLIVALGTALAEKGKPDEALDIFWRAFEKTEDIDDKTSLILKLVPLYQSKNQFDALVDRLKHIHRSEENQRVRSICLAQAYSASDNHEMARQELEQLLAQDTRDTNLLQQLAKVCEAAKNLEGAIKYQRQLAVIAPGYETEMPLARMLQAHGDVEDAEEIILGLAVREEDTQRLLKTLDSLIVQKSLGIVTKITRSRLDQQRDNWELLYRDAVALGLQNKTQEATSRLEQLLAIRLPHDTSSESEASKLKKAQSKAKSENLLGSNTTVPTRRSTFDFSSIRSAAMSATAIASANQIAVPVNARPQVFWTPKSFGEARLAAYAWLQEWDENNTAIETAKRWVSEIENRTESMPKDKILDYLYVTLIQSQYSELFRVGRILAMRGGIEEQEFFLNLIPQRGMMSESNSGNVSSSAIDPLDHDDIQLMLSCFENLSNDKRTEKLNLLVPAQPMSQPLPQTIALQQMLALQRLNLQGPQVIQLQQNIFRQALQPSNAPTQYTYVTQIVTRPDGSQVTMSQRVPIGNATSQNTAKMSGRGIQTIFDIVLRELRLAGKNDVADHLLTNLAAEASTISHWEVVIDYCIETERHDLLKRHLSKWLSDVEASLVASYSIPTMERCTIQICRLIGYFQSMGKSEDIVELIQPAIHLACRCEQISRKNPGSSVSPNTTVNRPMAASPQMFLSYHGNEMRIVQFELPELDDVLLRQNIQMVRQFYDSLFELGLSEKLQSQFVEAIESGIESGRTQYMLFLAMTHWWNKNYELSLEWISKASERDNDDVNLKLGFVATLERLRNYDRAWEVLRTLDSFDPSILFRKDWLTMHVGWRVGERELAAEAAERISAMNIDRTLGLELANMLNRLGKEDLAESLQKKLTRATTASASRTSVPRSATASASRTFLSTTNQAKSAEILNAKNILSRPRPSVSSAFNTALPASLNTSIQTSRTRALETLRKHHEIEKMILEFESSFEKSPKTFRDFELLSELYVFENQADKVNKLFEKAIATTPELKSRRILFAKTLNEANQKTKACDLFVELLREDPNCLNNEIGSVLSLLRTYQRIDEIKESIKLINVNKIPGLDAQIGYLNFIMSIDEETALRGIRTLYEQFPELRSAYLSSLSIPESSAKNLVPIVLSGFEKNSTNRDFNVWDGWNDTFVRNTQGYTCLIPSVLKIVKTADQDELGIGIEELCRKRPEWIGGKLFLALIQSHKNPSEAAHFAQSIQEILNEKVIAETPFHVCENIANELEKSESTKPIAWSLLERVVSNKTSSQLLETNSSISKLISWCVAMQREKRIQELLRQQFIALRISDNPMASGPIEMFNGQRIEYGLWLAGKQIEIGYPFDAIQSCESLMICPEVNQLSAANVTQTSSGRRETYLQRCRELHNKAIHSFCSLDLNTAFDQCMPAGHASRLDLATTLPTADFSNPEIKSKWMNIIFKLIEKSPPLPAEQQVVRAKMLDDRITSLHRTNPEDTGLLYASALLRLKYRFGEIHDAVQLVWNHTDTPTKGDTDRLHTTSKNVAPYQSLWLVANECLKATETRSLGEKLATKAQSDATGCRDDAFLEAMQLEWSHRLWLLGDHTAAQEKLREFAQTIVESTTRKDPADSAMKARPLSTSRFDLFLETSKTANRFELYDLSRQLLRKALEGGLPYPDRTTMVSPSALVNGSATATQFVNGTLVVNSRNTGANPFQFEMDAIRNVILVVDAWRVSDHDAEDVYQLLKDIVFTKTNSLLTSNIAAPQKQPASLATTLVQWAKQSNNLDQLETEVAERAQNASTNNKRLLNAITEIINANKGSK